MRCWIRGWCKARIFKAGAGGTVVSPAFLSLDGLVKGIRPLYSFPRTPAWTLPLPFVIGWFDALETQVDLGLSSMMRHMYHQAEHDLTGLEVAISGAVHLGEVCFC